MSLFSKTMLLALFLIFGNACQQKDAVTPDNTAVQVQAVTASTVVGTLTTGMTSNRNLASGSTFVFTMQVKNGTKAVANAVIGIDDPMTAFCTTARTDANGNATYRINVTAASKAGFYAFRFYYGSQSFFQVVSVKGTGFVNLTSYRTNMTMETTLSATTDAVATKVYAGNSANILNTAMTLGKDAATSYLKSKTNLALVGFTAIACTAGEFIPAAGQAACLTGLRAVAAGFTKEVAKTWVKGLIDRNTSLTTTQKANYKLLVDASTTAFDVFSMNPTGGMIDQIENFGAVSDVTDLVLSAVDNNTFCIVYKKRNSSAVYQIGVCKR